MRERLTWTPARSSGEEGRAGGIHLFTVRYGMKRQTNMWSLSTSLPIKHPTLGQHYPTPTDAKAAAERLLDAFLSRVDPAAPTTEETR